MELYGFFTKMHHGFERVLTVMSPAGAAAALAHIRVGPDLTVNAGPGQLTQYIERRDGALAALVREYGIVVLEKPAWDAKKTALGEAIRR